MRTNDDDLPAKRPGKRNAARILTWLAAGGVLTLLAGGTVAFLIIFPPSDGKTPTAEAVAARARELHVALTPEEMDAIAPKPDAATVAALDILKQNREWGDRGDFSYFIRHGVDSAEAETLMRNYRKEATAADTLYAQSKPVNLMDWRVTTRVDPTMPNALATAAEIQTLSILMDIKGGATDKAVTRLKTWTTMLLAWPKGITPVEAVQRSRAMRTAMLCVVRAAEAKPDPAFWQRLLTEIVEPVPMPDPRPVMRANASITDFFARQQAGLPGTDYPESMQQRFNQEWSFAPAPMKAQVLEAARQEVLRDQVSAIEALDKGWPDDVEAAETESNALTVGMVASSTATPVKSFRNMLLSASVTPKNIVRACRAVAVYRDLAATAVRLIQYRAANNAWPSTLDQVGPPPVDAFSKEPLHASFQRGPQVWSVGADRTDDNGQTRTTYMGDQGDIVLYLDRYGHFQFAGS